MVILIGIVEYYWFFNVFFYEDVIFIVFVFERIVILDFVIFLLLYVCNWSIFGNMKIEFVFYLL